MEKYFGNAYRGDPGVPHTDPDRFVNIWIGSAAFSALTWVNPYMWHLTNQFKAIMEMYFGKIHGGDSGIPHADPGRFLDLWTGSFFYSGFTSTKPYMDKIASALPHQFNWHDKAMLFEQYHWKKALKKKQPYKFKWNETMDKDHRDSYYFNWPVYFP